MERNLHTTKENCHLHLGFTFQMTFQACFSIGMTRNCWLLRDVVLRSNIGGLSTMRESLQVQALGLPGCKMSGESGGCVYQFTCAWRDRLAADTQLFHQFICEEKERLGSEDKFWTKFSDANGTQLRFQAILNQLQSERKERDAKDSANALRFFHGDLAHPRAKGRFGYKKGGRIVSIPTKDAKIARVWRKMLEEDAEVAAQWAAVDTENTENMENMENTENTENPGTRS